MAGLRTLELHRSHGLDVDPLTEAPRLREVTAPRCTVLETELASLNAALGWVDETAYVLPEPRPLANPRLISCAFRGEEYLALPPKPSANNPRKAAYGDDPLPAKAEDRWFGRELQDRLARILTPGWGRMDVRGAVAYVTLQRSQDVGRLREVVQALREVRARARFPWECVLFYEPVTPRSGAADAAEDEEAEGHVEWSGMRQRREERQKYLELEHRMRLRRQQGLPPEPELEEPDEPPAFDEVEQEGDTPEEGDFVLLIDEPILWVHQCDGENAAAALGQEPEEWHLLPEPPEERPRHW
jgi:hypothetical protein